MLITCPSGLSFQARAWRIGDRKYLHDQKILRQGLLMRKMINAVDEGIENSGPYDFAPGGKVDWGEAALVDLLDGLIDIRIVTKPILDYNENCESCKGIIPISIDLRELSRTPMSDAGKNYLSTGEPHAIEINAGTEEEPRMVAVKIKMLRGKDSQKIAMHYKQDPSTISEAQLCMHIAAITDPSGEELTDHRKIRAYFQTETWELQSGLEDAIAEFTGGVFTKVELFCNQCSAEQEGVLPFGGEFFYPKKRRAISSMAML